MVIYSESVQRVLYRICWQDFGRTGDFSQLYYECEKAIAEIPSSIITIIADRPFNWAREKGTIIKVKNLWFLYKRNSKNDVIVEEVYDARINQIVTESKHNLIKEAITPILDLQERWNKIKY